MGHEVVTLWTATSLYVIGNLSFQAFPLTVFIGAKAGDNCFIHSFLLIRIKEAKNTHDTGIKSNQGNTKNIGATTKRINMARDILNIFSNMVLDLGNNVFGLHTSLDFQLKALGFPSPGVALAGYSVGYLMEKCATHETE